MRYPFYLLIFIGVGFVLQDFYGSLYGSDAVKFFNNLAHKDVFGVFYNEFLAEPVNTIFLQSALTFPIILKVLSFSLIEKSPDVVLVINACLLFPALVVWSRKICSSRSSPLHMEGRSSKVLLAFLLFSPTVIYWSSVLAKEVTVLSFVLYSAILFFERKYFFAFLLLLMASILRPYSIFAVMLYYFSLNGLPRMAAFVRWTFLIGIICSIGGYATLLVNASLMVPYLIMSPSPLSAANWLATASSEGGWVFPGLLLTLEGTLVGSVLFIVLMQSVLRGKLSQIFLFLLIVLFLSSIIFALVGHHRVQVIGMSYEIGYFGDMVVRKKVLIWPLVIAATLSLIARLLAPSAAPPKKPCRVR